MLQNARGLDLHWNSQPELVIVMRVLQFERDFTDAYVATRAALSERDADEIVRDLRNALAPLTGGRYSDFASVTRDAVEPGAAVRVSRRGQIVIGRFEGLKRAMGSIGHGVWTARSDGIIITGAVMLDSDCDRTCDQRTLVRAHELGHALGYSHVLSRPSIMNPTPLSQITPVDVEIAALSAARRSRPDMRSAALSD